MCIRVKGVNSCSTIVESHSVSIVLSIIYTKRIQLPFTAYTFICFHVFTPIRSCDDQRQHCPCCRYNTTQVVLPVAGGRTRLVRDEQPYNRWSSQTPNRVPLASADHLRHSSSRATRADYRYRDGGSYNPTARQNTQQHRDFYDQHCHKHTSSLATAQRARATGNTIGSVGQRTTVNEWDNRRYSQSIEEESTMYDVASGNQPASVKQEALSKMVRKFVYTQTVTIIRDSL